MWTWEYGARDMQQGVVFVGDLLLGSQRYRTSSWLTAIQDFFWAHSDTGLLLGSQRYRTFWLTAIQDFFLAHSEQDFLGRYTAVTIFRNAVGSMLELYAAVNTPAIYCRPTFLVVCCDQLGRRRVMG